MDISALLKAAVASSGDTKTTMMLGPDLSVAVTIYASPLTPNDLKFIARRHPNFMMQPSMEGMVDLIIQKARDDSGQKVFNLENKPDLMRLNSNIITGAFGELFGEQLSSDEDEGARKGKSKATG
jgi:hypothetical protein